MVSAADQLVVALDVSTEAEAARLVRSLGSSVRTYKVGLELYTAEGPKLVRDLVSSRKNVFLDLKYHDIPHTVAAAVRQAGQLQVDMLTVHAAGGLTMLQAACEAAREIGQELKVLAVTVLTSMHEEQLQGTGIAGPVKDQVLRLAALALKAGCHGLVSSAQEVRLLRAEFGEEFLAVTPGVRPRGSDVGDQVRVVTPAEAIAAGATHIVVGRPIIAASDPAREAEKILQEIAVQSVA
ncbi:MAG: orotidine-5'-phosphate decarboxylase [Acidobacteria bacterium]|nr:orotidine-5'-phosphate decarboxylase [Acidobacteriota bacterium]